MIIVSPRIVKVNYFFTDFTIFSEESDMFYQKLVALCAKNNISVSKMCKDIGLVPSTSALPFCKGII